MSTEADYRAAAQTFLTGLRDRNWGVMQSGLAADAAWIFPGTNRLSGVAKGPAAIIERAKTIVSEHVKFELKHLLIGREGAALSLHNTARRGELIFDEHVVTTMKVRDGKIVELSTYFSDLPMLDTFFA